MAEHNELGKKGEQLAIDFLIEKNIKFLKEIIGFKKLK
jgi:hypothetical protein